MNKSLQRLLYVPVLELKARRLGPPIVARCAEVRSVLDFGCGDMVITRALARLLGPNVEVTGVDIVDTSLTERAPVLYDGVRLPFDGGAFDASVAIFALHHCEDELAALAELCRVTKRRIFIIEEPCNSPLERAITSIHDWFFNRLESWSVPVPFHFHSDTEWREAFARLGWRVAYDERVYQVPFGNLTRQVLYVLEPLTSTVPSP